MWRPGGGWSLASLFLGGFELASKNEANRGGLEELRGSLEEEMVAVVVKPGRMDTSEIEQG